MVSLKNNKYHTHMCGNLNAKHIGAVVKVAGWVNNIRKMGALTFITLRDQTGVVQVFVEDEKLVENLSRESTVSITGEVRSERMVELYEVAVFAKKVELELFLECEYGEQMVETVYLVAAENKLMELEQVVAVFINVYLQG